MHRSASAPVSVAAFAAGFPFVGFSGSRGPSGPAVVAATLFCRRLSFPSGRVVVGCASGVDLAARSAFPGCAVLRAASSAPWALAARSSSLVRRLQRSGGCLLSFPGSPCPPGVSPGSQFRGCGSGTWGTLALAVGLRVPVACFVPSSVSRSGFPAPAGLAARFVCWGGSASGSWWVFNPIPVQSSIPF